MTDEYPNARPAGVNRDEAIALCAEWLRYLGETEVIVHPPDVRSDLRSSRFIAWVENETRNVGLEQVKCIASWAEHSRELPLLFFAGGISPEAQDVATEHGIGLFRFSAAARRLSGQNTLGRELRHLGA